MVGSFTDALAHSVIPLDGGLGTCLESRGNDVSSALWSAALLRDNPDEVVAAHVDYFRAGARVATTCAYQVSEQGFSETELVPLLTLSSTLAQRARTQAGLTATTAWIAASVGPYGAALANGSEYTGRYDGMGVTELRNWHRARLQVLSRSGADFLLCETIPSLDEVRALSAELAALEDPIPAVLSMTVAHGKLRSGASIAEAVRIAEDAGVVAIGVNCASVADTTDALERMSALTSLPLIAYPNSGEKWNAASRSWSGDPALVANAVPRWIELGARLIGGCCRVDTAEIARISAVIAATPPPR